MSRGQALVELAICAPVVALLGLCAAAAVQVAEAETGLVAATQAAAAVAARAPDATAAASAAQARFASVIASYPVRGATLSLRLDSFAWGATAIASASGVVEVGYAPILFTGPALAVRAKATATIESWRTHR